VEFERTVPASGNMTAAGRQIWLGRARAGQQVTVWTSTTTLHVFADEQLIKTQPVTLTQEDLVRLCAQGARPGRPSPASAVPAQGLAADAVVEIDRMVNCNGLVGLAGRQLSVGLPLAGRRVTLRLQAHLMQVIVDGVVVRTLPHPLDPSQRVRLQGARLSQVAPEPAGAPLQVQRVVSSQGTLMVAGCKVQVGQAHRGKVVTVVLEDARLRIVHQGQELSVHPRTVIKEVNRRRASGHIDYGI
jgi:hypothetical protein